MNIAVKISYIQKMTFCFKANVEISQSQGCWSIIVFQKTIIVKHDPNNKNPKTGRINKNNFYYEKDEKIDLFKTRGERGKVINELLRILSNKSISPNKDPPKETSLSMMGVNTPVHEDKGPSSEISPHYAGNESNDREQQNLFENPFTIDEINDPSIYSD